MRCNRFSAVLTLAAVAVLALAGSAGAAIVIDSQTTINGPGGAHYSPVDFGSYDASGADKLVVLVGGGRDRGSSLGINSVTYGSTTLTEAVKVSSTVTSPLGVAAGVYYLDSPGAAGNLVVDYAGASWGIRNAVTVLELLGTEAGHGPVGSSADSASVSLTTVADDSLVLATSKAVSDSATEVPQSPLVDLSASRIGSGYQFVASPATVTPTFSTGDATVAAAFEAAATGGGGGDLAGELGVLDPGNANGGINPATGAAWAEGDQYRLAFHTSTTRDATSTDINDYNAFVNTVADGSVAFPDLGDGDKWKVVGSTETVSARQNTGTETNSDMGIFVLDGTTMIAQDSDDMWNGFGVRSGSVFYSPGYLDEEAFEASPGNHGVNVATGTHPSGSIRSFLGGPNVNWGSSNPNNGSRWALRWDSGDPNSQWRYYALSDPLSVTVGGGGGDPPSGPVDIPIVNGSFEDPTRGQGGYGAATGWDAWGPGADVGNWYPEGYQFTSGAPDGDHVGWAYQYAPLSGTPNGLTQVLTTNFEAGTEYELTVEVGNAWDYYFSGYAVQLLAGDVVIGEDNNTLHPAWEEWATSTVAYSYDPAHAGLVGLPLEIRLLSLGLDPEGGGTDVEVEFDNVRLTALSAAVPEPSTFALAALGLLGLAFYARRRRRS